MNKGKLIAEDMEKMMEDIVDTALTFIDNEKKAIFLVNCAIIAKIHQQNVQLIIDDKLEVKNE